MMTKILLTFVGMTLTLLLPMQVRAHGGAPTVAFVNDPIGVGNVVDESFTFTWLDFDKPVATGTATVDFYYVATRPPTFAAGIIPDAPGSAPIVEGLLEKDPNNLHQWDTRGVPAGSYMIWSRVNEPPSEIFSPLIISYSPGVVTVAHPGDDVHPAVMITTPDTAFRFADDSFEVKYEAFDPNGTGRVKIEAGTSLDGSGFITLADDLPAVANGSFIWETRSLPELDWTLRATITDDRGLSFVHYGRYFLLIVHLGPIQDAGVRDAPNADGSEIPEYDGGNELPVPVVEKSCGCRSSAPASTSSLHGMVALALLACGLRRR